MVSVDVWAELAKSTSAGWKLQVRPAGTPGQLNATVPTNPRTGVTVMLKVVDPVEATVREAGEAATEKSCGNNPKTPTPFVVPTNTLPFAIIGVMNLFPLPKLSRPFAA